MSGQSPAPVAIFAFNRPDKLRRLIASVHGCELAASTHFVFFIDGPRHDRDRPLVDEVKAIIAQSGLASAEVRISEVNKGLRRSVYDGIGSLIASHGRAIALEDDLILSPIALRYFNEALDYYEPYDHVWSICGYLWDTPALRHRKRALVLPITHSWGWATWARAWNQFDLDARPSDATLASPTFRTLFDADGFYPFTEMLRRSIQKLVSSWYAHWNYTMFIHGGCSIFPPRRVLDNIGIGAGSHGGPLNPHGLLVKPPPLLETMPELPPPTAVDFAEVDLIKKCREIRIQRGIIFAGGLKRSLKARFKRG